MYRISNRSGAPRRNALALFTIFTIFIFLVVTGGPAWSLELVTPSSALSAGDTSSSLTTSHPALPNDDHCLSLLETASLRDRDSDDDRNYSRRSAGQAAALGVVFGVRFALGPKEIARDGRRPEGGPRFDVWQPSADQGVKVLAVSAYRECKKEAALEALSGWRWQR